MAGRSKELTRQLAQRIGAHAASIRASKDPLRLSDIEAFLREVTAESAAPSELPPWEQIGMFIARLGQEISSVLPKMREAIKNGQTVTRGSQLTHFQLLRERTADMQWICLRHGLGELRPSKKLQRSIPTRSAKSSNSRKSSKICYGKSSSE